MKEHFEIEMTIQLNGYMFLPVFLLIDGTSQAGKR